MGKLLIINVTYHMPQNRVRDTITHVTLYTVNGGVEHQCVLKGLVTVVSGNAFRQLQPPSI
jgi:hypothetical protein